MVDKTERLAKAADEIIEIAANAGDSDGEMLALLYSVIHSLTSAKQEVRMVKKYGLKETKA